MNKKEFTERLNALPDSLQNLLKIDREQFESLRKDIKAIVEIDPETYVHKKLNIHGFAGYELCDTEQWMTDIRIWYAQYTETNSRTMAFQARANKPYTIEYTSIIQAQDAFRTKREDGYIWGKMYAESRMIKEGAVWHPVTAKRHGWDDTVTEYGIDGFFPGFTWTVGG